MQAGVAGASIAGRDEIRYQTGQDQAEWGASVAGSDSVLRSPASMLRAASVAIVGASERARWASQIFGNLRQNGYGGKIHLVNPRQQTVYGERCFPSLRDIGEPVDHAMVIVPAANVADVLTDAEAAGVKSATIYASAVGDGESEPSRARGAWLKNFLADSKLRVSGPNCMGSYSYREKLFAYPNTELCKVPPGPVAGIFQSGGTMQFWLKSASDRGLRFSYAVSSGNEADLDLADFLDFMVDDPHTKQIVLFIEGIRRPQAFMRAAARALRSRQAGAGDQDRRHAEIAHGGALAYRRHRRRLCGLSGDVRALRHRQLPLARRSCGMHAGVPVRPAAEGPAHRLRHHFGRHGRSALRLCRDRRRRGARVQRRHQRRADAAHAGRHCAEKSARRRHSIDAQGGRRPVRHRGARSRHRYRRLGVVAAGQGRRVGRRRSAAPPVERDRQAGAGVRPHDASGDAGRARHPGTRPDFRSCKVSSRRCAPSTRCGFLPSAAAARRPLSSRRRRAI